MKTVTSRRYPFDEMLVTTLKNGIVGAVVNRINSTRQQLEMLTVSGRRRHPRYGNLTPVSRSEASAQRYSMRPNTRNNSMHIDALNVIQSAFRTVIEQAGNQEFTTDDVVVSFNQEAFDALEERLPTIDDACGICRDSIPRDENVKDISCGHEFHIPCIEGWLTGYSIKCPMCRADLTSSESQKQYDGVVHE